MWPRSHECFQGIGLPPAGLPPLQVLAHGLSSSCLSVLSCPLGGHVTNTGILNSVDTGVVSKRVNTLAHIDVITWPDVAHPSSRNVTLLHVLVIVKLCMVIIFICIGVSLNERRKKEVPLEPCLKGARALCWGGGVLHRRWDKDDGFFPLQSTQSEFVSIDLCVCAAWRAH